MSNSKLPEEKYTLGSIALMIALIGIVLLAFLYITYPFTQLSIEVFLFIVFFILISLIIWIYEDHDDDDNKNLQTLT